MFIIFIDMDYHLLYNAVVNRNNNYYQNQKTNKEGIYGAGDVCIKELRQVVTAVSDGAKAATSLEKYVEKMHRLILKQEFDLKIS